MSHHDPVLDHRALDSAFTYHQHVAAGITTAADHQRAASLADSVAAVEYCRAAVATTARERRMFLHAGDKARETSNMHRQAVAMATISERASR